MSCQTKAYTPLHWALSWACDPHDPRWRLKGCQGGLLWHGALPCVFWMVGISDIGNSPWNLRLLTSFDFLKGFQNAMIWQAGGCFPKVCQVKSGEILSKMATRTLRKLWDLWFWDKLRADSPYVMCEKFPESQLMQGSVELSKNNSAN